MVISAAHISFDRVTEGLFFFLLFYFLTLRSGRTNPNGSYTQSYTCSGVYYSFLSLLRDQVDARSAAATKSNFFITLIYVYISVQLSSDLSHARIEFGRV